MRITPLSTLLVLLLAGPVQAQTVAFYGSSTTYGVGASRPDRRYSSMLCRMLGWQELNAGLSGATVASEGPPGPGDPPAVARWKQDVVAKHPDRIVAMLGANDAARDLAVGPGPGSFQANLGLLLDTLPAGFAPAHLALVTAQRGKLNTAHRAGFDQVLLDTARRVGALGIDAEPAFPAAELPAMAADDIHMNDLGHATVASYLAAAFVDGGWAPKAAAAHGGSWGPAKGRPLPGGRWLVAGTLSAGELRGVKLGLSAATRVRVGVVRPTRQGFERLYRTAPARLGPGEVPLKLPRWRVEAGDRLVAWSETPALQATAGSCLAYRADPSGELTDLMAGASQAGAPRLASN